MRIPLINSAGQFEMVYTDSLFVVELVGRTVMFRGEKGRYTAPISIKDWSLVLEKADIIKASRSSLVNVKKVKRYDEHKKILYIGNNVETLKIEVSKRNIKKLSDFI